MNRRRLAQRSTRLKIKMLPSTKDAYGGFSNKLVLFKECWGSVETLGGSAGVLAGVLGATNSHRITVRFDPAITADMVVELPDNGSGKTPQLRISMVEDKDLRHVDTVMMCSGYKDGSGDA